MSQVEGIYYPATMSTPQSSGTVRPSEDVPDSQESSISTVSSTFSAPKLPWSCSALSTSTTTETALTTPTTPTSTSTNVAPTPRTPADAAMPTSPGRARAPDAPPSAPPSHSAAANAPRTGDTAAAAHGFKRTADGSLKGDETAASAASAEAPRPFAHAHKRNKSTDTHRIGELSAQLKTRLSYAMVKVQNGWEKQSLDELEEVHSQRGSPNSAPGRTDRLAFDSPSAFDRQRRPSGVSEGSDHMLMSPASDPSVYWRPGTKHTLDAAANLMSVTGTPHAFLAPAPDLQPTRRRRSSTSHPPPPLLGATQRKHFSDLGSTSRAPATPRAGILRMPSQQAERDAVDTLLFMGSPGASQRYPHSHPAPSPLRADAPQRRVMFDAYPPQERRGVYQPSMPPPQHHQYGPYAAHHAR